MKPNGVLARLKGFFPRKLIVIDTATCQRPTSETPGRRVPATITTHKKTASSCFILLPFSEPPLVQSLRLSLSRKKKIEKRTCFPFSIYSREKHGNSTHPHQNHPTLSFFSNGPAGPKFMYKENKKERKE